MARKKQKKAVYTPPPNEVQNRKPRASGTPSKRTRHAGKELPPGAVVDARGRVVRKPTLRSAIRPLPLLFLLFVGAEWFLLPDVAGQTDRERLQGAITAALMLAILYVPMSYFFQGMVYRRVARMSGAHTAAPKVRAKTSPGDADTPEDGADE